MRTQAFDAAQAALLAEYNVVAEERRIRLADPPLSVHVLEAGAGEPVLLVHGSGMSAATWNALAAQRDRDVSVSLDQSLSVRSGSRSRTVVVASRVSARSLGLPGAAW